jgi:hypothetical protein
MHPSGLLGDFGSALELFASWPSQILSCRSQVPRRRVAPTAAQAAGLFPTANALWRDNIDAMGKQGWSGVVLGSLCAVLLAGPVVAASEKSNKTDISGYVLPGNTWLLGKKVDAKSLKGFKEVDSFVTGQDAYLDLSRDIQFAGEPVEATVGLFLHGNKLACVVLQVDSEEKTFKSLRKYYKGRYDSEVEVISDADGVMWEDDDEDYLGVFKYEDANGNLSTLIIYGRNDLMQQPTSSDVPDWMQNMLGQG